MLSNSNNNNNKNGKTLNKENSQQGMLDDIDY